MRHWLRETRAGRGAVGLIALLVAVTCLLATAGGAWLQTSSDTMWHRTLVDTPAGARTLHVRFSGEVSRQSASPTFGRHIVERLSPAVRELVGRPSVAAWTTKLRPQPLVPTQGPQRYVTIAALQDQDDLVTWVRGRAPHPGVHQVQLPPKAARAYGSPTAPVVEVGLTRANAEALKLPLGSYSVASYSVGYTLWPPGPHPVIHLTGIFEPTRPTPGRLDDVGSLVRVPLAPPSGTRVDATALAADPGTVLASPWTTREMTTEWTLRPTSTQQPADRVDDLEHALTRMRNGSMADLALGHDVSVLAESGLAGVAARFLDGLDASNSLVTPAAAAVLACALLALVLAARILALRRRHHVLLLRARGASVPQLLLRRGLEAVLLTFPGVLLGWVGAGTLRGSPPSARDVGTGLVAGVVCVAALTAVGTTPVSPTGRARTVRQALQDAVDVLVVVLAALGSAVLLTHGSLRAGDPFLVTVPVLVAIAATLLALRQLPRVLWRLRRLAGRARGIAVLVAASRAVDAARASVLPALIVVLAVSTGVLTVAVTDTMGRGVHRAAWEQVGADVAVHGYEFHQPAVRRVAALPRVGEVAAVTEEPNSIVSEAGGVTVVDLLATDVSALREVQALAPAPLPLPAGTASQGRVPVLASPDVAPDDGRLLLRVGAEEVEAQVAARAPSVPGLSTGDSFVLTDTQALRAAVDGEDLPPASALLVRGHPDHEALAQALGDDGALAALTSRTEVEHQLGQLPLGQRAQQAFWVATVISLVFALSGAVLAIAAGATERRRTAAVLRAVGATRRQTASLSAAEVAPTVVLAPVVGVLSGLLLSWLAAHGLDLAPLTGDPSQLRLWPDLTQLGGAAIVGLGVVILALAVTTAVAARQRVRPISELGLAEET